MSILGYWKDLWSAVRGGSISKQNPGPPGRSVMAPFYYSFTTGTNRPQPKVTMNFSKLRAFSESPIPRRAIDYIKNQVSMLEWDIAPMEGGGKLTGKQKAQVKIIKSVLHRPNSRESWRTFIEMVVEDMLVIGYSAVELQDWKTNPKKPIVLYPFDAASLNLYLDWNGSPTQPRFAQIKQTGEIVDFRDEQMMVLRFNPRTNTPWGLSPLEVAAMSVDYLLNAQSYASRRASNATPDYMVDLGEDIDQDQVKEFRQWWKDEVEGRGSVPIIGGGKGSKSITLGQQTDEGLYLKWQQFLINQIAIAFGLDSMKFGVMLAGSTRSSGDSMDDVSDEGAIRPLAHSLAAAINKDILGRLGIDDLVFKFRWTANFEDRKSLASVHQIYGQMDVMTLDEIRNEIGLPPLPDGKGQYTVAEYRAMYGGTITISGQGMPAGLVHDESNEPKMQRILDLNTQQQQAQSDIKTQADSQLLQQKNQTAVSKMKNNKEKPQNQPKDKTKA